MIWLTPVQVIFSKKTISKPLPPGTIANFTRKAHPSRQVGASSPARQILKSPKNYNAKYAATTTTEDFVTGTNDINNAVSKGTHPTKWH